MIVRFCIIRVHLNLHGLLSLKTISVPIQDTCFMMTIVTLLLDMIKGALAKAFKEENWKSERVVG